jgi:cell division protein FtsZ
MVSPSLSLFSLSLDDVLRQGVVGISEIIIRPGLINVDFADVRAIMGDAGTALMGIGRGNGRNRATEAAAAAISSPLLDFPIEKARGVVFNIVGGNDLTLQEINSAAEVIFEAVDPNANIIFGALVDESMEGEIAITVIATGFPISKLEEEMTAEAHQAAFLTSQQSSSSSLSSSSSRAATTAVSDSSKVTKQHQSSQHHKSNPPPIVKPPVLPSEPVSRE